jgi:hypothetical protein
LKAPDDRWRKTRRLSKSNGHAAGSSVACVLLPNTFLAIYWRISRVQVCSLRAAASDVAGLVFHFVIPDCSFGS